MADLDAPATPAEVFVLLAERLYGSEWQSSVARYHHINLRTVQRISAAVKAGKPYRVPEGALVEMATELSLQAEENMGIAEEALERFGAPS